MQDEHGGAALDRWTLELQSNPASVAALKSRGTTYLQLGQPANAEKDARAWLTLQPKSALAFGLLGEALLQQSRNDEAVRAFKQGITLDASDAALHDGLSRARVAVFDELAADDTVPTTQPVAIPVTMVGATSAQSSTSPTSALVPPSVAPTSNASTFNLSDTGQIVPSPLLPSVSLASLMAALVLDVLKNLNASSPQLSQSGLFFVAGVTAWCMHRVRLFSVVAGLVVPLFLIPRCQRYLLDVTTRLLTRWLDKSTDKLYHVAVVPCVAVSLPMLLRLVGLVNLFSFIHKDLFLACGVTIYLTTTLFVTRDHPKLVKAGLHLVVVLYWVVHLGHSRDIFRFIPPIAFDIAGYLLASISPLAVQEATKKALATQLTAASSQLNVWGVLALGHWAIDYWNQPSTLSVDDIVSTFQSLQSSAVQLFQAEIQAHRRRTPSLDNRDHDEYAIMVAYVAKTVRGLPPSRPVALAVMLVQRCVHMVAFTLLVVFGGHVSFALVPFIVLELDDLHRIGHFYQQGAGESTDTLDAICTTSPPLLAVWTNLKAGVYCLEYSVVASQVASATASAASLVTKLSGLATTIVAVRREGLVPHANSLLNAAMSLYESRDLVRPMFTAWTGAIAFWQRRS